MKHIKERIIVLKNIRHLESHLIIKGLSRQGNILSLIARHGLKSKRRFAGGVLEPGGYIEVEYQPSRKPEGLHQIQGAWTINKFEKIRKNWDRLNLCFHILKIINQVGVSEGQGDPELFDLLGNTFLALENTKDLPCLKLFFEMKFLFIQGVLPSKLQNRSIFFENTISSHHTVDLSQEDLPLIENIIQESLHQYLNL